MPLRLIALIRVSRRGGREELRSPDQQRATAQRWADGNDAVIVDEYISIDVSAKTMDRDDVDAAVARIRSGEVDGIVVAWLDRFSRARVDEALRVFNDIQAAGGRLVAADMAGFDPRDPTGELALTVMLGVNRYQLRQVTARYEMSIKDAIADGKKPGPVKFGYRYTDATPKAKGGIVDSHLVPVEELRPVVLGLFQRKAEGGTWLELARWLDEVVPRPDGTKWHRNTVRGIIKSRTYLGEVFHGPHRNVNAHEPLVPLALWRRAQPEPGRRTPRGTYLLTGLVRCAACGRRLKGGSLGSYRGAKRIYQCDNRSCPARSTVIAMRLDAEVTKQFFEHLDAFHVRAAEDRELGEIDAELERLTGEVERVAAVIPSHRAAIAAHQDALAAVEATLTELEDRRHRHVASRNLQGDVHVLRRDWQEMDLAMRREHLRTGIDAVLVRRALRRTAHLPMRDRILVVFRGDGPEEIRDNGRASVNRRFSWDHDITTLVASG